MNTDFWISRPSVEDGWEEDERHKCRPEFRRSREGRGGELDVSSAPFGDSYVRS